MDRNSKEIGEEKNQTFEKQKTNSSRLIAKAQRFYDYQEKKLSRESRK